MILSAYKENWEEITKELEKVREEIAAGRKPETEGISIIEAPFYDCLISNYSFDDEARVNKTKELIHNLMPILKETAAINNFWSDRAAERRRIEGLIEDEIRYSRIEGLAAKAPELVTELMKLAKTRESDLR